MVDFNKQIGIRIKNLREEIGFSQEQLAGELGVRREVISNIENGKRKATVEELSKISKILNTSVDLLIDASKDISVIISKDQKPEQPKTEIRIDVPQKNLIKFKEVLLYVLNKIGSKPNIGETVLYKILYFIDFDYYEKYEEQLIGATYQKNNYGPTPKEFIKIVQEMDGKDLRKIKDEYFKYPQTKYLPLREPDLAVFSAKETRLIDQVIAKLADMNASQISEYSHGDVPWLTAEDGKIIEYESVFYRTAPYSVRD
ncbi:MAG: DUF4065 domain-containing protein [Candidatus Cloacimonadales bacterium]|nr:DUF4065 domain-containing protein [Candidatus Cloacimonadales bacterium]